MRGIKKINNKGVTSITYVIAMLTTVVVIVGLMSIMMKTMSINEIQGIVDNAGVVALRYGVDDVKTRQTESLVVDKGAARIKFKEIVNNNIKTGPNNLLVDFKIKEVNIYAPGEISRSLGISNTTKDQYMLETIVTAKYKSNPIVDTIAFDAINYFDFLKTNKDAGVTVMGKAGDGLTEVIVRSVTRVVME